MLVESQDLSTDVIEAPGAGKIEQRIAKIRRQKRKRSRRAKQRLLADKRHQGEKKSWRAAVRTDRGDD